MKEVKAFIRGDKADEVIAALEEVGVINLTVINVMGIGRSLAPSKGAKYSVDLTQKYSTIAKIEIVCRASDTAKIVDVLRQSAYTGMQGDGMIYVVPVETAVKIRTGAYGGDAL
ncbi:MAG: P-II family nitrogen regulator [Candidatus Marinimicrobia bacterium]|nr:P-II family nitrogen regulator [Candidatus Neomarinimicrobiota bacterium]